MSHPFLLRSLWVSAVLAALPLAQVRAAPCDTLARLQLPHAQITRAEVVNAGAFAPSNGTAAAYAPLPSFCRVTGAARPSPDSDIRFEVWMPVNNWNGKFVGVGNGAWAGSIPQAAMADPLSKGYATAATDGGHEASALDARFGVGHPEKLIDWAHRAPHEMTVAAKAAIAAFYGRKVQRALFASCSTGGRQALMEAYRYPEDYDAISAMAPANPVPNLMVGSLWTSSATARDAASRLSADQFALVHKAAIAACDADDGVKDGLISSPRSCRFDPTVLQCQAGHTPDCLTQPQVAALHAMYQGARNPRTGEPISPGFEKGSEALLPIQASGTGPFPAVSSYFRDLLFNDARWDFRAFDYDKDFARALDAHGAITDVPPSGLEKYFASGRKLLLSQGWADPLIPPQATIQFYEQLGAKKTAHARLFMIPGMGHCEGGDGPFVFDALATIDRWAETGRAPERIVVNNPPNAAARSRPLCPYPQIAAYSGQGSTDDERNFRCEAAPAP